MTGRHDPERWPLAPGNAPPEVEARFAAEAAAWPEPSAELRDQVSGIFRRAGLKRAS
ncbi:hypothetical protein MYK68_14135 [Gordonia sp. PP30]|uniref:hypothetical protein n=1 Tax=Gordonia sp. PP30 TaxID=2935861 RepID=UPI001FFE9152|nr:hypothetical protein [Gordonia sp. PP30]UQE73870.1 hypothetical protein MYK68_14135 [Gordonia sp. PP30]